MWYIKSLNCRSFNGLNTTAHNKNKPLVFLGYFLIYIWGCKREHLKCIWANRMQVNEVVDPVCFDIFFWCVKSVHSLSSPNWHIFSGPRTMIVWVNFARKRKKKKNEYCSDTDIWRDSSCDILFWILKNFQ